TVRQKGRHCLCDVEPPQGAQRPQSADLARAAYRIRGRARRPRDPRRHFDRSRRQGLYRRRRYRRACSRHCGRGRTIEQLRAGGLLTRAEAILKQIFANAPIAVKFSLEAVNRGLETNLAEGLSLEASLFGLCAGTGDKAEGTSAFLAKRTPQFHGN